MNNFCTLFDVNYIERGIVLYNSLEKVCPEFTLYIITMDEECYNILCKYDLRHAILIKVSEMENDILKKVKQNRSYRAYCWTCSSWSIQYVITNYRLDMCTYLDADMYFYSNPDILIRKFRQSNCSVGIIGHNFGRKNYEKRMETISGRFCVEFNSFKNDERGMTVLKEWCIDCANECDEFSGGKNFGDQKYLEKWPLKYDGIYIYDDIGAGIAPWNIYRFKRYDEKTNTVYDKITKNRVKLIFVHFHNLVMEEKNIDLNVYTRYGIHNRQFVSSVYIAYIKKIYKEKYNIKRKFSNFIDNQKAVTGTPKIKQSKLKKVENKGIQLYLIEGIKFKFFKKMDIVRYDDE